MKHGAVLAAALLATGAHAQTVQRCEGPDGRVTYANGPCPAGSTPVRNLAPDTAPSAADQKAAQERARRAVQQVAQTERDRKAEEARLAREQEKLQAKARKQEMHCRRLETRLRLAQEDLASATLKRQTEAQRRVRRAEALYTEDCGPPKQ